jgi:hypothetical protein
MKNMFVGVVIMAVSGSWAGAQLVQQGGKLVGTGAVGHAGQGFPVAVSADGNTALMGGAEDNNGIGAAWVFTRSGSLWTQQGEKLVGAGAADAGYFSVALSADGDTLIIGRAGDNGGVGAAWVFTRSGALWSQQGEKLVGTGVVPRPEVNLACSISVAISGDGDTAILGRSQDDENTGAAWVFTRSAGVWAQQAEKLVANGAVGTASQGASVALSFDGTTAVVDDAGTGATWVFTPPGEEGNVLWVPVVAHNPGLDGTQWRSDLGLLNPGTATADVQLTFHGPDGVVTNTTYVPAGTQSILVDVVAQLPASGQGALAVASDQPLKVTSRTYHQASPEAACEPGGTEGQSFPALAPSAGLSEGQTAWLPHLTENVAYRTNIGLANSGAAQAEVTVVLYDGAGGLLASYTVTLAPGEWRQESQPFRTKAGQTAMDRGYARVTVNSGAGVVALASVVDNVTNDPTTISMQR